MVCRVPERGLLVQALRLAISLLLHSKGLSFQP